MRKEKINLRKNSNNELNEWIADLEVDNIEVDNEVEILEVKKEIKKPPISKSYDLDKWSSFAKKKYKNYYSKNKSIYKSNKIYWFLQKTANAFFGASIGALIYSAIAFPLSSGWTSGEIKGIIVISAVVVGFGIIAFLIRQIGKSLDKVNKMDFDNDRQTINLKLQEETNVKLDYIIQELIEKKEP
jgi:hypothetical protein